MSMHGAVNPLMYVHGGNAFHCAHISLHADCNNVSMCIQSHKFGTLEQ